MATITNYARGPRGITLKSGEIIWLEPGQSEDIAKDDIAGPLPDLGTKPKGGDLSDDVASGLRAEIDRLKAEHGDALTAQTDRADTAEHLLTEARAEIDRLKAQVAKIGEGKTHVSDASDDAVKSAISLLDTVNDDHWTAAGLPSVDAVAAIAEGKVTRAQIERVAPDARRPG